MITVALIVVWILCALVGSSLANEKGRSSAGFWLGLIFGPIGIIIALLLPPATPTSANPGDLAALADLRALLQKKAKTGIVLDISDGRTITAVADGSPAYSAGIRRGDRLVSIDNKLVDGNYKESVMRLVGDPDTVVTVAVRRGDIAHEFSIPRS